MPFNKFPPVVRAKLLGMMMAGSTIAEAASKLGVSVKAIQKLRARDPEFAKEWDAAKDLADDVVEASLLRTAMKGNVRAQRFWLTNRRPARWRDRREVAVSGELSFKELVERSFGEQVDDAAEEALEEARGSSAPATRGKGSRKGSRSVSRAAGGASRKAPVGRPRKAPRKAVKGKGPRKAGKRASRPRGRRAGGR